MGSVAAQAATALFYFLTLALGFFGIRMPLLGDATPLGIGLSLVLTGVAALNLIFDFDVIERGAQAGAPKYMEWYGGFALPVTLVWLYLESERTRRVCNGNRHFRPENPPSRRALGALDDLLGL